MTASGPYDTERDARAAALAAGGPARPGWSILSAEQNRLMLAAAIAGAGVETARYDDRIIGWLAGFEDSACAVIAGLITRAHQSVISPADLMTVDKREAYCTACGLPVLHYTPGWVHWDAARSSSFEADHKPELDYREVRP